MTFLLSKPRGRERRLDLRDDHGPLEPGVLHDLPTAV